MNDAIRMQLSAFVDGELPENEAELLLRRMSQDSELRQEVAEYLAIGRLMRDEAGLRGADRLHRSVAAEIDDHDLPEDGQAVPTVASASWTTRPLTGLAVAAAVALIAIFTLRESSVNEVESIAPVQTVVEANPSVPTISVPTIDVQEERQRALLRKHAETTSAFGANGMNSRVVALRFSENLSADESDDVIDDDNDASSESVIRP